jgi:hypothetical protein
MIEFICYFFWMPSLPWDRDIPDSDAKGSNIVKEAGDVRAREFSQRL